MVRSGLQDRHRQIPCGVGESIDFSVGPENAPVKRTCPIRACKAPYLIDPRAVLLAATKPTI